MEIEGESGPRQWYVIHTYSGYEGKVKRNLEHRKESMRSNGGDKVFSVIVPEEEEMEIRNGQRQSVKRKVYPGYVLVEMEMTPQSWQVVKTPQVLPVLWVPATTRFHCATKKSNRS